MSNQRLLSLIENFKTIKVTADNVLPKFMHKDKGVLHYIDETNTAIASKSSIRVASYFIKKPLRSSHFIVFISLI